MEKIERLLDKIKNHYIDILKLNLVGIYVHGSLAFECFHWDTSDVDLIVVVKEPLTNNAKEKLIQTVLDLEKLSPKKGIEMSVVLERYCNHFCYPTPYELHFSNMHKTSAQQDLKKYCMCMYGKDKDLAVHFTIINKKGKLLYGKEINSVFEEVDKKYFVDSILEDIKDAKETIHSHPVYIILNLCRTLAYLQQDIILSKQQGGEWGIEYLSFYKNVIEKAMVCYQGKKDFIEDKEVLDDFSNYVMKKINYKIENC